MQRQVAPTTKPQMLQFEIEKSCDRGGERSTPYLLCLSKPSPFEKAEVGDLLQEFVVLLKL